MWLYTAPRSQQVRDIHTERERESDRQTDRQTTCSKVGRHQTHSDNFCETFNLSIVLPPRLFNQSINKMHSWLEFTYPFSSTLDCFVFWQELNFTIHGSDTVVTYQLFGCGCPSIQADPSHLPCAWIIYTVRPRSEPNIQRYMPNDTTFLRWTHHSSEEFSCAETVKRWKFVVRGWGQGDFRLHWRFQLESLCTSALTSHTSPPLVSKNNLFICFLAVEEVWQILCDMTNPLFCVCVCVCVCIQWIEIHQVSMSSANTSGLQEQATESVSCKVTLMSLTSQERTLAQQINKIL